MGTRGSIGFIKNKKKYLMHIQYDANELWDIACRELFILIYYYCINCINCSFKELENKFLNLKVIYNNQNEFKSNIMKNNEKKFNQFLLGTHITSGSLINTLPEDIIIKIKDHLIDDENYDLSIPKTLIPFTDNSKYSSNDWYSYLKYCQGSYINIVDSGYFLNNGYYSGYVLLLDFDKLSLEYLFIDHLNNEEKLKNTTLSDLIKMDFKNLKKLHEIYTNIYNICIQNLQNGNTQDHSYSSELYIQKLKDLNLIT